MYFIEILSKFFNKENLSKIRFKKNKKSLINEEIEKCEHMFVPIDSTGKVFSCINCGLTINKKPKNLNFVEENK